MHRLEDTKTAGLSSFHRLIGVSACRLLRLFRRTYGAYPGKTRLFRIRFGEGSESLTLGKAAVLQQTTGTVGGDRILDQLANKKITGLSDAELGSLDAREFLSRDADAA